MFSAKTKIMIVDHSPEARQLIVGICQEIGFLDFLEVDDVANAWKIIINSGPVGLIIAEWSMPNGTSLGFLQQLRSDSRYKKLPFIVSTSEAEKGQILEAIQAGANAYLLRPLTVDILRKKLKEITNKLVKEIDKQEVNKNYIVIK